MKNITIRITAQLNGVGEATFPVGLSAYRFAEAAKDVRMVVKDLIDGGLAAGTVTQEEYEAFTQQIS